MDPPDNTGQPSNSRLLLHDIDILAASDDDEEAPNETPTPGLTIGQVLGQLAKIKSGKIKFGLNISTQEYQNYFQ